MGESRWYKIRTNPYVWLFLMTSALFGLLFIRFILGDYGYFYLDTGGDTFDINYPMYSLFAQAIQGGNYENYMLNVGVGMDMSSYLCQYANPINLLVALLPVHLLPWSVLFASYLKLLVISIWGYKLFFKWIRHQGAAFGAALAWTFSSYVILWGQQYGFCTAVAMFTVFLYLVHLYVEEGEKSKNWLLVLWITLMLFTSYYYLYMSGIIAALYLVIYLLFYRKSPIKIIKKLLGLAGMGILGICMGGICLIPTWNVFVGSTRATAVNANHLLAQFHPYKAKWLFGFLGRFFSNNTLGIAFDYTGAGNYYEIATLFTSSLFALGMPCLLRKKGISAKSWVLLILSILFLILPFSGKLFTMNAGTQRWSFLLCFLEALAIGLFLKELFVTQNKKDITISVFCGFAFAVVAWGLLYLGQGKGYYTIKVEYLLLYIFFLTLFAMVILAGLHWKWLGNHFQPVLLSLLCVELFASNYATINFRESPTRSQIASEKYNDGTRETWQALAAQDPSLYRVTKTYESASENDSMAQGYPGLSGYMSTNPKSLITFKDMYGGNGVSDNFVSFDNDNVILNSLLGMKYILANPGDGLSKQNYTKLNTMGNKEVYENNHALPFGYLYDAEWSREEVEEMPEIDRTLAALSGFYFTDQNSQEVYPQANRKTNAGISLMDRKVSPQDCQVTQDSTGITITQMTQDPNVVLQNVGDVFGENGIYTISMKVKAAKKTAMAVYYKTPADTDFRQDQILIFHVSPENPDWTFTIPGDVKELRIDISTEIDQVTIQNIEVNSCQGDNEALEALKESNVEHISYKGNTYQATVDNALDQNQMLCVPFLYSDGWQAKVDQKEVPLYNINSGLCGITVPQGTHQVILEYHIPHKTLGMLLSLAGLMVYLIWILAESLKGKKKEKNN